MSADDIGRRLVTATGPRDPRLYDIDDDFRQVLIDLSGMVAFSARRKTRFLHPTSIGVRGRLDVVADPQIPAHTFFRSGRSFPVIGRYSTSQGEDDLEVTVRGLSLRLLDPDGTGENGLLDLMLNTGECFFAPDADTFRRLAGGDEERDRVVLAGPRLRTAFWSAHRRATSFPAYDLYSQVPRMFAAEDGTAWLARFRVLPHHEPVRPGHYDHGDRWWPLVPPDAIPRPPGATGAPTALRDRLRSQVIATGVDSVLEVKLHPVTGSGSELERALDASRPWPGELPWETLAHIRFDGLMPDDETDAMAFDPGLAPPELGILLSRTPFSTASLNHLRALVYQMTSHARLDRPMPAELAELLRPVRRPVATAGPSQRVVCVLGAGPSGLAAAREIERNGHRAIVVEAADEVAGKAASVEVDGHVHDLGAHICTGRYQRLAALAAELGVETEPTPAERVLTVGPSGRTTTDMAFFTDGSVERYEKLRAERFPQIGAPGLAHSAAALSAPLSGWLAEHAMESMYRTFGLGYTCAGYGFPDADLPALYFVKYVEMTGLLSDATPTAGRVEARFTVKGGFGALWQRVARELGDVRCGTKVVSIERHDRPAGGVLVRTNRGTVEADELLITVPPDQVLDVLDATRQEREPAEMVRYHAYRTTVASVSGLPREAFYLLGEYADDSGGRGHCIGFQHRYPGSDVYTCYSYLGDDTAGQLERDLEACGGRDFREHLHRDWRLMPHFTTAGLRAGALEQIEYGQGRQHTWFTGGLLGFESVECAVSHAQDLVRRAFPAGGTPVRAAGTSTPAAPFARSAAEIRVWLTEAIAEALDRPVSEIDPAAALAGLPFDSLGLAQLMAKLSDYLGFRVPHTLFLQVPTVDAVASYLAERETAAPASPGGPALHRYSPRVSPFFCVGGIGASATYLRPLAAALGPGLPLHAFEIPGRLDGTGEPVDDVEEIAAQFVTQVREAAPDGPYRLGGHSFGGVVAYEMGRQLRAAGADVAPVTLLDTFVAVPGQPLPAEDDLAALTDLLTVRHMACLAAEVCDCGVDLGRPLPPQREAIARALGAVDETRYEAHIAALIEVQLSSIRAYAGYPTPPSDLAVHLLKTEHRFAPMPEEDFGIRLYLDSPANGWERVGLRELKVSPVGGNHFSMFAPRYVRQVAGLVAAG